MTHTKQLLLVTFCCTTAGIGATFRTHGNGRTHGWTDRRGGRNSNLDVVWGYLFNLGIVPSYQNGPLSKNFNQENP